MRPMAGMLAVIMVAGLCAFQDARPSLNDAKNGGKCRGVSPSMQQSMNGAGGTEIAS